MPNPIPSKQRKAVKDRDLSRCVRCASHAEGGAWHHRRGRAVLDDHTHCACNGVWLCTTCHGWVHAHPFEAKTTGFIVTRNTTEPGQLPVESAQRGWITLGCDGTFEFAGRLDV